MRTIAIYWVLAAAVLAACGKDERKPITGKECDPIEDTSKKFQACTKLTAADRTKGDQALHSVEVMLQANANAKKGTEEDMAHVTANTCKEAITTLEQLMKAAGC